MPNIPVNSFNIGTFSFTATFDLQNRRVIFDSSATSYNNASGQGIMYVQGISFFLKDQDGIVLAQIDFTNHANYIVPSITQVFMLDLSSLNYAFLFQTYEIQGAIKDQNGTIYTTLPVYAKVCQPVDFTESGYVPGMFVLKPDCPNNTLSVSEVTLLVYNKETPVTVTKSGVLNYPTGTISPVSFTGTPFQNNVIRTGQYNISNNTIALYDLDNGVYVAINYYTNNVFDVICGSQMSDLNCCIQGIQQKAISQCDNAIGMAAKQQLLDISTYYMSGISKEINGQDSTFEYEYIKKYLNCNCGSTSIRQNEETPINPSVYSILVVGVNGSSVSSSQNGSTKTFTVSSNIYQIVKGNGSDLAFTLQIDTTPGVTKTIITFNYAVMAGYIITAIAGNNTLIAQLNALVTQVTNIDLTNLDGSCVINLSSVNYFLSQLVPDGSTVITSILIGSTTHNAPGGLLVSNVSGVESWLNGLNLGDFESGFSNSVNGAYFNLSTVANSNSPVSIVLNIEGSNSTVVFQKTNKSLIAVLQAVIDYLCSITAIQVALGSNLSLYEFDYNGSVVTTNYSPNQSQNLFNQGISASILSLVKRLSLLTGVTCAKIQAIFQDYPNAIPGDQDRVFGVLGGACASLTDFQLAEMVFGAINKYLTIREIYCQISCSGPITCPDISGINVAMSGSNIGIYGVSFASVIPVSTQTVTVKYRLYSSSTWIVATNNLQIFPNGNISGTSPFLITGVSLGATYQIQVINNCGGFGFVDTFTTPTSGFYSQQYRYDSTLYLICGQSQVTLYTSTPFGTGVFVYTDMGLTTPLTGYTYIATPTGAIWGINPSTGQVSYPIGTNCNSGAPGSYRLGNSTGTICAASTSVLYTNGGFAVGGTIYMDSALSTPVSGYSYIVFNNIIYNINSSTGQIIGSTGTSCTSTATLTASYTMGAWTLALNNAVPFSLSMNAAVARGTTSNSCASFTETDSLTTLVIPSGNVSGIETNVGLTSASTYYRLDNTLTVNGNVLTNGGTVVISGVTITVVIMNTICSPYTS